MLLSVLYVFMSNVWVVLETGWSYLEYRASCRLLKSFLCSLLKSCFVFFYWNHIFFFYWNHVFYWWECLFLVWLAYNESCPLIMPSVSHIWYITFGISLTYCSCYHVLCFILKSVMSSAWSKSVLQFATGTHFACPLVIILQCVAYTQ